MRLTRWNGKKYVLPQGHGAYRKIAERLAAYENSGYEPDKFPGSNSGESLGQRVFISGPITGIENFNENFSNAEKALKEKGFIPVNPARVSSLGVDASFTWNDFMDLTLCLLKKCSAIYMLDGWELSRGASLEYCYAITHGYKLIEKEGVSHE